MNKDAITPGTYQAEVVSNIHLSPDYYLVQFTLVNPKAISFEAGQYVSFHLALPKLRHTMSIASKPDPSSFEILQCVAPGGYGSHWAEGLKPGDKVEFTGPLGKFALYKESHRKKIFVATSCGVAPFRAMILDYLEGGGEDPIFLLWGMRFEKDLFWLSEWQKLAADYPNFHYQITLSKPEADWQGARGRVTEHVLQDVPDLAASEFYLCGSKEMILDVKKQLADHGVPEAQIYYETFY